MGTELLMTLYKQWGVTHYTFDVIVLTSSEKSFSRLHHRIFLILFIIYKYSYTCRRYLLFIYLFAIQKTNTHMRFNKQIMRHEQESLCIVYKLVYIYMYHAQETKRYYFLILKNNFFCFFSFYLYEIILFFL